MRKATAVLSSLIVVSLLSTGSVTAATVGSVPGLMRSKQAAADKVSRGGIRDGQILRKEQKGMIHTTTAGTAQIERNANSIQVQANHSSILMQSTRQAQRTQQSKQTTYALLLAKSLTLEQ